MSEATIALSDVAKSYGKHVACVNVDLVLHAGERVALVGHNGAGKSTIIKLMLGLIRPSAGRIEVLGEYTAGRASTRVRRQIGYLPESLVFPPAMSGLELMAFYARLKRWPVAGNAAILDRVGLAQAAGRRVGTYSKGMRQRLGLAQALIGAPRILLLDEPTSGLDPALRQSFYEIVAEISGRGATVLLSSHALAEIEGKTDRVVIMNQGRKIADGTIGELRRLAQHPVVIKVTLRNPGVAILPTAFGNAVSCERVGAQSFVIRCPEAEKVDILRRLTSTLTLDDIEIVPPTLDDVYARFQQEAAE